MDIFFSTIILKLFSITNDPLLRFLIERTLVWVKMHILYLLWFKHDIEPVIPITNCHFQCFLIKFASFRLMWVQHNHCWHNFFQPWCQRQNGLSFRRYLSACVYFQKSTRRLFFSKSHPEFFCRSKRTRNKAAN